LCELCPVVRECLAWALKTGETHGVWGGMLPRQRRRVKKAILESNGEGRYL
jgi:WhiB family redox-sensing transcriptional regulator